MVYVNNLNRFILIFRERKTNSVLKANRNKMKIYQQALQLKERKRGFHLITTEIIHALPQLSGLKAGVCQVFIQHTSASLTINENADVGVRKDFEMYFNKTVPENDPDYLHDDEGSDDMPAHLKAAILGSSIKY